MTFTVDEIEDDFIQRLRKADGQPPEGSRAKYWALTPEERAEYDANLADMLGERERG